MGQPSALQRTLEQLDARLLAWKIFKAHASMFRTNRILSELPDVTQLIFKIDYARTNSGPLAKRSGTK
jgi:hypothetical protein